jgi:hypothetical protein
MYAPHHPFFLALQKAQKAVRRGDIETAERWVRLAERFTSISQRIDSIIAAKDSRLQKSRAVRNPW